jgi:hydroxyacylglutathione hydrolase
MHPSQPRNSQIRNFGRLQLQALITLALSLSGALAALSQPAAPATLGVHWNEGAKHCSREPQVPLQVHAYSPQTFIIRQNLCISDEANFMYLLVGSRRALLIDTGAIASPDSMPLAETVMRLLPDRGAEKIPLLVVHTHKHLDHRAGDAQFKALVGVQVEPADLDSVKQLFEFKDWPDGVAHLDLGERVIDVIPAPGHQDCHVVFYDNDTAILFSGDFLMPGRLLINDRKAFQSSAVRILDYLHTRPVSHILGGHIELSANDEPFRFGSRYHPDERPLGLSRDDLQALPAAVENWNGFYKRYPHFILFNSKLEFIFAFEEL